MRPSIPQVAPPGAAQAGRPPRFPPARRSRSPGAAPLASPPTGWSVPRPGADKALEAWWQTRGRARVHCYGRRYGQVRCLVVPKADRQVPQVVEAHCRASSNMPHSAATSYRSSGRTVNGLPHRSLRTSGVHRPSMVGITTSMETADTPNITHPAVLGGPDANALRDANALTPHTAAQAVPNRDSAVQADSRWRSDLRGRGGPEVRSRQRAAAGMSVAANVNAAIAVRKNAEAHKGRPLRSRA